MKLKKETDKFAVIKKPGDIYIHTHTYVSSLV